MFVCLFLFVTGATQYCVNDGLQTREAMPIPIKDVDNVTISYDYEARLHWLQWLLFCPPRSQQLRHSRILIEPDYLSIFSHCKYIQSKCSGNSTLKPLKSVNCGIHWMPKVHWKLGHSEKLYFLELEIFAVCASRILRIGFDKIQEFIVLR